MSTIINAKIVLIGWTPLHATAAYNGTSKVIETLLEAGVNPKTPYYLLMENNNLTSDSDIYEILAAGK